jgi:hypothetical protein
MIGRTPIARFRAQVLTAVALALPGVVLLGRSPAASVPPSPPSKVAFEPLLEELGDPLAPVRGGPVAHGAFLVSSRDPASVDSRDAIRWFSESDAGHFLRLERWDGRYEWVLADVVGPGAITRMALGLEPALAEATLRIRLDGRAEPVIEYPLALLAGAAAPIPKPLCEMLGASRGGPFDRGGLVWRLPIPFAQRCLVTIDRKPAGYQIDGRDYARGGGAAIEVESLAAGEIASASGSIARIASSLAMPASTRVRSRSEPSTIEPGERARRSIEGRGVVGRIALEVEGASDFVAAHDLWIEVVVDGVRTACAPVSAFFGRGESAGSVADRFRATRGGSFESRLPIAYARSLEVAVSNRGRHARRLSIEPLEADAAPVGPLRTLHAAHVVHGPERFIEPTELEAVRIEGSGLLVGTTISARSPLPTWWGVGDERIFVDRSATAIAGTGVDLWLGVGRGLPRALNSPFATVAPRSTAGRDAYEGLTTVSRWRALDAIPFSDGLRSTIECIPASPLGGQWTFAHTTFWYAEPGASRAIGAADPGVVDAPVNPENLARIPEWIEAEEAALVGFSMGSRWEPQDVGFFFPHSAWSGGRQLFLRAGRPGEWVEFEIPADGPSAVRLSARFCKASDYGRIAVRVNGAVALRELSLFDSFGRSSDPIDLGVHAPVDGRFRIRVEVLGPAPESNGMMYTGVDAFRLQRVETEPAR